MANDDLKPSLKVEIEGEELSADVTNAIVRCDTELAREVADQITMTISNPVADEFGSGYVGKSFVFLEEKVFQPGNEVRVYYGYGEAVEFVAGGIIQKFLPNFPENGVPKLTVIARDASVRLMDGETAAEAMSFPQFDLDTAVLDILNRHQILPAEVTPLVGTFRTDLHKKRGMTDYQFVKGLANIVGHEFRVRMNPKTFAWEAVWRPPTSEQEKQFTFTYLGGPESTLLSFDPEWGLHDSPTEVKCFYFDKKSRTWELLEAKGKGKAGESTKGKGKVTKEIKDLDEIRIATGDIAVEIVPERPFRTPDEAQRFADRWLRARKDLFLTGRGKTPGLETLRAGDVHILEGIGVQLSGEWEMTTVNHIIDRSAGYNCTFFAHKVLT